MGGGSTRRQATQRCAAIGLKIDVFPLKKSEII
jgi:hypothetical protein